MLLGSRACVYKENFHVAWGPAVNHETEIWNAEVRRSCSGRGEAANSTMSRTRRESRYEMVAKQEMPDGHLPNKRGRVITLHHQCIRVARTLHQSQPETLQRSLFHERALGHGYLSLQRFVSYADSSARRLAHVQYSSPALCFAL